MNQAILSTSLSSAVPVAAGDAVQRRAWTGSRMTTSRVIGALFLAGFLLYGVGGALVASLTGAHHMLATISAHQTLFVLGAFLMLLNTPVDVAKAVLFFPILEQHSKRTALTYLATMIVEVVFLTLGVLALLMLVPLGQHAGAGWVQGLGSLAVQANALAYQVGELVLGGGALFLCALLFRTRLIPRWLALSGLIGYVCLAAGCIAEIFGLHIGLQLTIPGLFFELALPFWLFIKGFQPQAYNERTMP
jgi:uncharacterized membrane protein YidH (DUF202 family)